MRQENARAQELQAMGIYVNLIRTIGFKGMRGLVIGNGIWFAKTEKATFHELILDRLRAELGEKWWKEQHALAPEERHFIYKCYEEFSKFTAEAVDKQHEGDGTWSAPPNGYAHYLLNLAFDVYMLQHSNEIPKDWLRRLRIKDQYQGVRYEIAVASIFARMGCKLEFFKDSGTTVKHPEFKATHTETSTIVAVEAKSRHRDGVINQPGQFDLTKAVKGDIGSLFTNALQKDSGGLPYLIFIDVNAPRDLNEAAEASQWYKDVRQMVADHHVPTQQDPDTYALLCVTNYSHHYEADRLITPGQNCFAMPVHTQVPIPGGLQSVFLGKLQQAINGYGFVPNL